MWLLEFLHAAERQMDLAGKPTRAGGRRDSYGKGFVFADTCADHQRGKRDESGPSNRSCGYDGQAHSSVTVFIPSDEKIRT